jgi:hypothetical protein
MSNPNQPICGECDQPIAEGDGVWHQPFAASVPTDQPSVKEIHALVSTYDNGGIPLHRSCFQEREPDVDISKLR